MGLVEDVVSEMSRNGKKVLKEMIQWSWVCVCVIHKRFDLSRFYILVQRVAV